jgi:hypothetical protein
MLSLCVGGVRDIMKLADNVQLHANNPFSVVFKPDSRKARDTRPLSRWGILVAGKNTEFKNSSLNIDGCIWDLSLMSKEDRTGRSVQSPIVYVWFVLPKETVSPVTSRTQVQVAESFAVGDTKGWVEKQ